MKIDQPHLWGQQDYCRRLDQIHENLRPNWEAHLDRLGISCPRKELKLLGKIFGWEFSLGEGWWTSRASARYWIFVVHECSLTKNASREWRASRNRVEIRESIIVLESRQRSRKDYYTKVIMLLRATCLTMNLAIVVDRLDRSVD